MNTIIRLNYKVKTTFGYTSESNTYESNDGRGTRKSTWYKHVVKAEIVIDVESIEPNLKSSLEKMHNLNRAINEVDSISPFIEMPKVFSYSPVFGEAKKIGEIVIPLEVDCTDFNAEQKAFYAEALSGKSTEQPLNAKNIMEEFSYAFTLYSGIKGLYPTNPIFIEKYIKCTISLSEKFPKYDLSSNFIKIEGEDNTWAEKAEVWQDIKDFMFKTFEGWDNRYTPQ